MIYRISTKIANFILLILMVCTIFAGLSQSTCTDAVLFKDINGAGNSFPSGFTEFGGKLYFQADDGANGTELWTLSCSTAPLIPTLSQWGVIVLGLFLMIFGIVALRDRQICEVGT